MKGRAGRRFSFGLKARERVMVAGPDEDTTPDRSTPILC